MFIILVNYLYVIFSLILNFMYLFIIYVHLLYSLLLEFDYFIYVLEFMFKFDGFELELGLDLVILFVYYVIDIVNMIL